MCLVTTLRQQDRRIGSWGPGERDRQVNEMRLRTTVFTLTASIWLGSAQLALHLLAQAPSLQANMLEDWSNQKDRLMKLASVMPAEQFGFKPVVEEPDDDGVAVARFRHVRVIEEPVKETIPDVQRRVDSMFDELIMPVDCSA